MRGSWGWRREEVEAVRCDGLPYILASRIVEDIYICPVCRCQYDDRTEFESHLAESTHATNADEGPNYKDVLMLAGTFLCFYKKQFNFFCPKFSSIPLQYVSMLLHVYAFFTFKYFS